MPKLTIPLGVIEGDKQARIQRMKEHWLREMGGRCTWCLTPLEWYQVSVVQPGGGWKFVRKPNLHAHHVGDTTGVEEKDRLANLYVVTAKKPEEQREETISVQK